MRRRSLVVGAALAMLVVLGTARAGLAAAPASGTVGPSNPSVTWNGATFPLGSVPTAATCAATGLCDTFTVEVGVGPAYWDTHHGSITVSISWPSGADDFDLVVFDGDMLEAASLAHAGSGESVTIVDPTGSYRITVVPVTVTDSGYSGGVTFESSEDAPIDAGGTGGSGGDGGSGGESDPGSGSGGGPATGDGTGSGPGGTGAGSGSGSGDRGEGSGDDRHDWNGWNVGGYDWPNASYDTSAFDTRLVYQDVRSEHAGTDSTIDLVTEHATADGGLDGTASTAPVPRQTGLGSLWFLIPVVLLVFAAVVMALFEPVADGSPAEGHPTEGARARPRPPRGVVREAAAFLLGRLRR